MSTFHPPNYSAPSGMGSQPRGGPPPSPPRMGFVAGAEDKTGKLVGYVGKKPEIREEPQNPQSRRQLTNFASPDPQLSQQAFTQSQFTSNISAAALQSASLREQQTPLDDEMSAEVPQDPRRANLRKYKEGMSRSGYGGGGGCGVTPHPSMTMARQQQQQQRGRPANNRGSMPQQQEISTFSAPAREITANNNAATTSSSASTSSFISYTLSDPGSMYKTFSDSMSWFRVMHLIVPEGKKVKRVYIAAMCVKGGSEGTPSNQITTYAIRLVDPNMSGDAEEVSWLSCTNTENFKVYSKPFFFIKRKSILFDAEATFCNRFFYRYILWTCQQNQSPQKPIFLKFRHLTRKDYPFFSVRQFWNFLREKKNNKMANVVETYLSHNKTCNKKKSRLFKQLFTLLKNAFIVCVVCISKHKKGYS